MTAKSKKNLVTSIDELTIDNVEAEANAAALLAAKDDYEEATLRLKEAHDDLKVLHQSAYQGSMIDPEEIKNLKARVEVEESYQSGSAARLRIIKDKRLVLDLDLLATVFAGLNGALPGVPLLVGLGAAPTEAPKGDLPILVLTQDQGSKVALNGGGSPHMEGGLTGRLHLSYFRSNEIHQPLSESRLQNVMEGARINALVRVKSSPGVDRAVIEVVRAIPAIPTVPHPPKEKGQVSTRLGVGWLSGITGRATTANQGADFLFGTRLDPRDAGRYINAVHLIDAPEIKSQVTALEVTAGVRTVTLVTSGVIASRNGYIEEVEAAVRRFADLPVGEPSEYGRVTEARLITESTLLADGASKGIRCTLTLTIVSKA